MDSHFREKNREVLLGNLKREFGHLQDRNKDKETARVYYAQALDLYYRLEARTLGRSYDNVVRLYAGTLWTDYSSGKYDDVILDLKSRIWSL